MNEEDMVSKDTIVSEVVDKVYELSEFTDEDLKDFKTGYKSVQKFPEKEKVGKIYGDKLADEGLVNEQMINLLELFTGINLDL